ncbi:hypothetical protein LWI29_035419 [Acer saccharum]|uniref:HMA domain-containing protein n=1 Tax=Acer saccharum TaxID=4024 RepID=A0AA39SE87_ACESA|nr:hypothetical protein LWI29_035419 [Acer saccharum]
MKKKLVIKVSMNGQKSRSKALKTVVGASGVESVELKGADKSQIEVTGDGFDPTVLTQLLRKKVGRADLVSYEEKKDEKMENEAELQVAAMPAIYGMWPYYEAVQSSEFRVSSPTITKNQTMKQKVVIKVTMNGQKSRSKALKIVVGASGVESAAWKGDNIEVTGEELDPACLTLLLRKKLGYADLVSVEERKKKRKKKRRKMWPSWR